MTDTTGTARDPRCSATAKSGARSMNQKRCTKCAELKALSEFRKDRSGKNGLRSQCKACAAAYGKRYRATHPERVAAKNRRWCQANPEKAAAYAKQWAQEHPEKRAATQQRRRARKLGATIAPFDESQVYERDGLQCVYCGSTDDLTLDHIVPLAGGGAHSIDNLTVACQSCNGSKGVKSLVTWLATMKQSSISDREGVTRR